VLFPRRCRTGRRRETRLTLSRPASIPRALPPSLPHSRADPNRPDPRSSCRRRFPAHSAWGIFALPQMRSAPRPLRPTYAGLPPSGGGERKLGSAHEKPVMKLAVHQGSPYAGSPDYYRRRCNAFRPNNVAEELVFASRAPVSVFCISRAFDQRKGRPRPRRPDRCRCRPDGNSAPGACKPPSASTDPRLHALDPYAAAANMVFPEGSSVRQPCCGGYAHLAEYETLP
jgi:hypothetical protein